MTSLINLNFWWVRIFHYTASRARLLIFILVTLHNLCPVTFILITAHLLKIFSKGTFLKLYVHVSRYLTNLMHKICFTISFISCLYMFRAHVLITRRSKLHFTASGIITPIGGRLVHRLLLCSPLSTCAPDGHL